MSRNKAIMKSKGGLTAVPALDHIPHGLLSWRKILTCGVLTLRGEGAIAACAPFCSALVQHPVRWEPHSVLQLSAAGCAS